MADEVQRNPFATQNISRDALDYQNYLARFNFLATLFFIINRFNSELFKDKSSDTCPSDYAIFTSAHKCLRSFLGIDSCKGGLIVTFWHIFRKGVRDKIFELCDINTVTL